MDWPMESSAVKIGPADLDGVRVYTLPMRTKFRRVTRRQGVLLRGPSGWGDFCPFDEYDDAESVPWLATALESCAGDWPEPVRDIVEVNCTVPAVDAARAHKIVSASGCTTAKVKIADPGQSPGDDVD